jgi:hypothetical protein
MTADGTFKGIYIVMGLVRAFNPDQAIRRIAAQAWRQRLGFHFYLIQHWSARLVHSRASDASFNRSLKNLACSGRSLFFPCRENVWQQG